ncbi:MAG: hypothetical protein GXO49_01755, partial [Chlorobi bacterium]|nr:hypothetical protein [Chlorobiota bacterium]
KSEFRKAVEQHIGEEYNLLNDFAIINDNIVYGEDIKTGLIRIFYNEDKQNRKRNNIIKKYDTFFNNLNNRVNNNFKTTHSYDWNERSDKQILNECNRMIDKQHYNKDQIIESLKHIIDNNNYIKNKYDKINNVTDENYLIKNVIENKLNIKGDEYNDFLTTLFNFMTDSKNDEDELIAIDLTPAKKGFLTWIHDKQYREWMKSTINVAKNEKNIVERLYIVDEQEDKQNIELIVDNIFIPQIEAGMTLYVVSEFELFENDIPYFDMLYVKNKMCHSLNINQTLINEKNNDKIDPVVSLELNLEHRNNFRRYEITFDNIAKNSNLKTLCKFTNPHRNNLIKDLSLFYKNLYNYKHIKNKKVC